MTGALASVLVAAVVAVRAPADPDPRTLAWMQSVVSAWEVTAQKDLRVPLQSLPWIIFFDDSAAWHVGADTALLPAHTKATATLRYGTKRYRLDRVATGSRLWVPDNDSLPVRPRAITLLYANGEKPFFIMPLPSLYRRMSPPDEAEQLDRLYLSTAMRELTHTRHLPDVVRRTQRLRSQYRLPDDLDEDFIESRFSMDTAYAPLFAQERSALNDAVFAPTTAEAKAAARKALTLAERRKRIFLSGDAAALSELEDMFLVLEGAGAWAQYRAARRSAPARETWQQTLALLMNRTASWSRGEGLALFVLLDRFQPNWQAQFMKRDFASAFAVLGKAIK